MIDLMIISTDGCGNLVALGGQTREEITREAIDVRENDEGVATMKAAMILVRRAMELTEL